MALVSFINGNAYSLSTVEYWKGATFFFTGAQQLRVFLQYQQRLQFLNGVGTTKTVETLEVGIKAFCILSWHEPMEDRS